MIEKEIIIDDQQVKVAIEMEDEMFDNNNANDFEKTIDLTNVVKKIKKERKKVVCDSNE